MSYYAQSAWILYSPLTLPPDTVVKQNAKCHEKLLQALWNSEKEENEWSNDCSLPIRIT